MFSVVDMWWTSRSYDDWASTGGVITYSKAEMGVGGCGPGSSMTSTVYYDYDVDGTHYTSASISNGMDTVSCGSDLHHEYPRGRHVTVYYDPTDPRQAVLKRTKLSTVAAVAMGVLLLGMMAIGIGGWLVTRGIK